MASKAYQLHIMRMSNRLVT